MPINSTEAGVNAFDPFVNGNLFGAIFTLMEGSTAGWGFFLISMTVWGVIAVKQESVIIPTVLWWVIGIPFYMQFPGPAKGPIMLTLIISSGGIIWRAINR